MKLLTIAIILIASAHQLHAQSRISGIVNRYAAVTAVRCREVGVEDASGFAPGDTVMIMQMKGVVTTQTDAPTFGAITSYGDAGNFELGIIESIAGRTIRLRNSLLRRYSPADLVQLIRVPYYRDAIVTGRLSAAPWNGRIGGVLVIDVAGTLTLAADIDLTGLGFRGGRTSTIVGGNTNRTTWVSSLASGYGGEKGEGVAMMRAGLDAGRGALANGGGGGNVHNAGGGGGGSVAQGGIGGDTYIGFGRAPLGGLGGRALMYAPAENRVFMGGGGGGGHENDRTGSAGGHGGGLVIIRAREIVGNGNAIVSRGADAAAAGYDGAGGGGAGGTVLLDAPVTGPLDVELAGGRGGDNNGGGRPECHGPGGGGSGGVLLMSLTTTTAGLNLRAPGGGSGMMTTVRCGYSGTSYGADAGAPGDRRAGYFIPQSGLVDFFIVTRDTAICEGQSIRLSNSSGVPVRWRPSATLSCEICPDPFATPTTTTTYVAEGTLANGCVVSDTVVITVVPLPRLQTKQVPALCGGDSVQLRVTGAASATWSPADGLECTNCLAPYARPDTTTVYHVTAVNALGCTVTDSVRVEVEPAPVLTITSGAICPGESTSLTVSGAAAAAWSPATGLSCTDCLETIARPDTTTTYRIEMTTPLGCRSIASVTVVVHPLPALIAAGDTSICIGGSAVLSARSDGSIRWLPSPSLSCVDCPSPTATPSATTTYVVEATSEHGCSTVDSVRVTVLTRPLVDAGLDTAVCAGEEATLRGSGDGLLRWTPTGGLACAECATTTVRPTATTTYVLRASSDQACDALDSVVVTVLPRRGLVAHIGDENVVAAGGSVLVPVTVDEVRGGGIDTLRFRIDFDPSIVLLDAIETDGTLLDGWSRSDETPSEGRLEVRFDAAGAAPLATTGTLLNLRMRGFLGSVRRSALPFAITTDLGPCGASAVIPGALTIDSLCGLSLRLFERLDESYSLAHATPNPSGAATSIAFSIALDAMTTLAMFDGTGRHVATLLERPLGAGTYSVIWDASGMPDGVYFYRIVSGDWSQTRALVLQR